MIDTKPDLSPFCMRARGFLAQGRVDDALGLYGDVLQVDTDNAMAYADRGTAYAMLKQFDSALNDLERAISLGYVDASALSTVATIYFEQKKYPQSLEYFSKAIEADPSYAFAYYNRSNVLYELGEKEKALEDLEECLAFQSADDFKLLVAQRAAYIRANLGG